MKKSRLRVKGIKVSDKDKIKEAIMISIQKGNYTTREIGLDIGKDYTTVSRYLSEMENDPKWGVKRDLNGNIVMSLQEQLAHEYSKLQNEKVQPASIHTEMDNVPEISKDTCYKNKVHDKRDSRNI